MTSAERPAPKRQARGERRIAELLAAAELVFARAGYERATTNAIAAEAGVSPGSLYQYFANKDDIVAALADRYAAELARIRDAAFDEAESTADVALDELVERIVRAFVDLNLALPAFKALLARTDMPASLAAAVAPVQRVVHDRVARLVAARLPGIAGDALERTTETAVHIVRGMMPLVVGDDALREARTRELVRALTAYLEAADDAAGRSSGVAGAAEATDATG